MILFVGITTIQFSPENNYVYKVQQKRGPSLALEPHPFWLIHYVLLCGPANTKRVNWPLTRPTGIGLVYGPWLLCQT